MPLGKTSVLTTTSRVDEVNLKFEFCINSVNLNERVMSVLLSFMNVEVQRHVCMIPEANSSGSYENKLN